METDFPYIEITQELQKVVGKPDPGTRIYRRKGSYRESGIWFQALDWFTDDSYVSPGGVSMYAPVSRAAVHRRLKEGRLTAFAFHVIHNEKSFFGTEREAKSRPYIYIPVSECKAWAKELERKQAKLEFSEKEDRSDEFLAKDPADRKNKKVRYTDEFLTDDTEKEIFKTFWDRKDDNS